MGSPAGRGSQPSPALGPDASYDDQQALLATQDVGEFDALSALSLVFADQAAAAWLGPGRIDLVERGDLVAIWPVTVGIGPLDAFEDDPAVDPAVDPGTGRLGLRVADPRAAAAVTLTEVLPFGVCNEVVPIPEPTGL